MPWVSAWERTPILAVLGACSEKTKRCVWGVVWPVSQRFLDTNHRYTPANPQNSDLKQPSKLHHSFSRYKLLGLVMSLTLAPFAFAEPPPEQPRIGLVLGGGGARGAAHIGVLKVLEDLHVPVHCIAGTSMGAIVGGLYASGMSPAEIEEVVRTADWADLLKDRPDRRLIPFRNKVDDLTYLSRFEIGFNRGSPQLPRGFVAGQKFGFLLQKLALPAVGAETFDELQIPFRAIATDIASGERVVIDRGDLAQAIRASMSVPGVFTPVKLDGRLLVDGGLVANLPVDVVRAMGADVVIAIDVGSSQPVDPESLASAAQVFDRMVGVMIQANVEHQAPDADIFIQPDLGELGSGQFQRAAEGIPLGEKAAREIESVLSSFAIEPDQFAEYVQSIRTSREPLPGFITSVEVTDGSSADPRLLLDRIRVRPGDPFDLEQIYEDADRLYRLGDYELVAFHLVREGDGYGLRFTADEKSWGPNILRFGFGLKSDLGGESGFGLLTTYRMMRLNRLRGELKLSLAIGEQPGLAAELYQPLTWRSRWFVSPTVDVRRAERTYRSPEGGLVGVLKADIGELRLDLGRSFGRWGEARIGLIAGRADADLDFGLAGRVTETIDRNGLRFDLILDQLESVSFPTAGWLVRTTYTGSRESFGSTLDGDQLTLGATGVKTWSRFTIQGVLQLASGLGSNGTTFDGLDLGGFLRLSGYPVDSISGPYGGLGLLNCYYRLTDKPLGLDLAFFVGGTLETGNAWFTADDVDTGDLRRSASIYAGVDLGAGPAYLAYGRGDEGNSTWYLFIGRSF